VSERQANRLLASEGTSVRRLLTQRRLEKCREALVDPLQRHRSIGDIASSFGFRDMSHFTHAFRDEYGHAPSEHRRAALA
jgi:AraC-like DNA-binding protein